MPVFTGMDLFIITTIMRNLLLAILISSLGIFTAACTKNQLSTQPTSLPTQDYTGYPSSSSETAYPPAYVDQTSSPSGNGIGNAYPSVGENIITPLPMGVLPTAPQEAPEPDSGKASISGILYSYTIQQVIAGTEFFLIPAVGPAKTEVPPIIVGPEASRGEIISQSDYSGIVSLKNIPPGNYYLVVWAPMSWSIAQKSETETTPLFLELKAGSRVPLGIVYISWP